MILEKGSFELDLKLIKLKADLSDIDRQCAWELYTELSTRRAITGKLGDKKCKDFGGEIYAESLDSVYRFFQESRTIMRKFPVGRLSLSQQNHLGALVYRMMQDVLRPFLERWQGQYRHWWENESDKTLSPFQRQSAFPSLEKMLVDWTNLRWMMRRLQTKLLDVYKLVDIEKK
jgi:hypothetical protein